jgi:hypothetical protein
MKQNVVEWFDRTAAEMPEAPALSCSGQAVTFGITDYPVFLKDSGYNPWPGDTSQPTGGAANEMGRS